MSTEVKAAINELKACEAEVQKLVNSQKGFVAQLNENGMVKSELDLLEEDAEMFKAVGPVLVKVELNDAKASVKQRIDRLTSEVERLEKILKEKIELRDKLHQKAYELQQAEMKKNAQE